MKDTLKQGVKTTRRFTVDENRVITFLAGSQGGGDDGPALIEAVGDVRRWIEEKRA